MKLKSKALLSAMLASVMVFSSFGSVFADTSRTTVDATTSSTTQGYDIDMSKVTAHEVSVQHVTANYKLKVYVHNYGNVIYFVEDKTTEAPGYLGNVWGQFKGEGGLNKYIGKTFDEVKAMDSPEPIRVMGGDETTPADIHKGILELVKAQETTSESLAKVSKTPLAKLFLNSTSLYGKRDGDEYIESTMTNFVEKYQAAERVLMETNPSTEALTTAKNNLQEAKDGLRQKPLDYKPLKAKIKTAREMVNREDEYSLLSMSRLKQVLAEGEEMLETGTNDRKVLKALETKFDEAIKNMQFKEEQGKVYHINGKLTQANDPTTSSMANNFMNPIITLEEKDGKAIYTLSFKKGEVNDIKSEVEYVKHVEGGAALNTEELPGLGEYNKMFRFTRNTLDENEIQVRLAARMAGPDVEEMPALLVIDLTSKRAEGETLEKADKSELEALIKSEKETFEDVNAGVYKPYGASEYLKKYDAALKVLEDKSATKDTVDKAIRDLRNSKVLDLSLNKDNFARQIMDAEEKEQHPENYTKESLARLKEAVKAANATYYRTDLDKNSLKEAEKALSDVMESLNAAGSHFDQTLTEGDVTLFAKLTEDTVLLVEKVGVDTLTEDQVLKVNSIENVEKVISVYNVSVEQGTIEGEISLTFNLGDDLNGRDIVVTHFAYDGNVESFSKKVEGGNITLETNSLSPFAVTLIAKADEPKNNGKIENNPKSNDSSVDKPQVDKTEHKNAISAKKTDVVKNVKIVKMTNGTPKTGASENAFVFLGILLIAVVALISVRKLKR